MEDLCPQGWPGLNEMKVRLNYTRKTCHRKVKKRDREESYVYYKSLFPWHSDRTSLRSLEFVSDLHDQLRKLQELRRREKFGMLFFSNSREINLECLAVGSVFLTLYCISESGCEGKRRPKGNSFIKRKATVPVD